MFELQFLPMNVSIIPIECVNTDTLISHTHTENYSSEACLEIMITGDSTELVIIVFDSIEVSHENEPSDALFDDFRAIYYGYKKECNIVAMNRFTAVLRQYTLQY